MFGLIRFCASTILLALVSSEVITLIKENNVTCVLTGDSIYSAVYIKNYETHTVARKIQEKENWFYDDWSISNVTDHFDLVIDERWMDFGLSNHTSDFTSFSVCLNETVWLNTLGENDKNRRHFEHSGNFCQWKHLIKNGNNLMDENHVVQPFGLKWFTLNGVSFKNHKYDFYYSNVSSTRKSLLYAGWSTCVSMYVSVDEGCYLNITLRSVYGTFKTEFFNGTNKKNNLKQWTRIILQDDSVKEKHFISFFRGTYNGNTNGFWAIDEIKDCNSDPVTYSIILENEKLPLQTRCQTLHSLPETSNSTICKQNSYLGQNCNISCDQILGQFYNNCREHQICSEKECYCAWGYQGATCNKSCDNNTWDINCRQKCNEGCKVCDNIVGCTECNLSHFGNDGLKKLPIVREAPELVSINENFIQIQPNLKYGPNESEPQYFAVQYKKFNSSGGFLYFGSNYSYSEHNANISMYLTTTEAYNVRIILITDDKFCDVKVPELIINKKSLKIDERGNNVDLHWSPPSMKKVTMFWLEYQWNTFCDNHTEKRGFNSSMTQATFRAAPSSSSYEINLEYYDAVIKKKLLIDQTNVMLLHSNKAITRNELPRSVNISEKKTILEIEGCEKFSGPVNYSITFTCLDDWCHNRTMKVENYEFKFYSSNISLKVPLLPNITWYNISVVAKRLDQKGERKFFRANVSCNSLSRKNDPTIFGSVMTGKIIGAVMTATFVFFALIGILWWLSKRNKLAKKRPLIEYEVKSTNLQENDALLEAILPNALENEVPLKIENFEQHVLSALEQDLEANIITEEFQEVPIISNASCDEGRNTENTEKNRDTNILPCIQNRQQISEHNEEETFIEHCNTNVDSISTAVKINEFENYLKRTCEDNETQKSEIVRQFQEVPNIKSVQCRSGLSVNNSKKNCFMNVVPYDHSRVVIQSASKGDYINASYIDGYEIKQEYIATQAPLKNTVHDFWTMIFQKNVEIIVMLNQQNPLDDQFLQYWPDRVFRFGPFFTECICMKNTPNYVYREIQIVFENQARLVQHFQFTAWPDGRLPLNIQSFIALIVDVKKIKHSGPVVVHSTSGCGKTGTYILCEVIMEMAAKEKKVDFLKTLQQLRGQRPNMVSRVDQYMFAHFVFLEYFNGNGSELYEKYRSQTVYTYIE